MSVTLVSQGILSLETLLAAGCQEVQQQSTVYALSPLQLAFWGARKVRLQKGNGIFAALDVCDTTNIIKINWGVCSACTAVLPWPQGKASQSHQSRFFTMWLCPLRALLSPQLSGRLCWFPLLINIEFRGLLLIFFLLSAHCRAPLCWGLLCGAILGGIFQIQFTTPGNGRTSEMWKQQNSVLLAEICAKSFSLGIL